jgi:hypothetical protein
VAAATARGERLLPWIAAERTARGLLLIAAGIYLLAHTGSNFGSIANHLARTIELDPRRPFIRHIVARLGKLRQHELALFGPPRSPTAGWNSWKAAASFSGSAGPSG